MKKTLQLRGILTLMTVIFLIGSISAQKNIMFITGNSDFPGPDGENALDSKYIEVLRDAGYEVTVITDAQTGADPLPIEVNNAVDACHGIMVSSTVDSWSVCWCWPVIYNDRPLLTWESGLWDDIWLSYDSLRTATDFADSLLTIEPDADTAIVGEYSGDIQVITKESGKVVFSGCALEGLAPDAHLVAKTRGPEAGEWEVIYYVKNGEECIPGPDGNTAFRLGIAYWFEDATASRVTDIGWELFLRTVAFMFAESENPEAVFTMSGIEGSVSSFYNGSLHLDLKRSNTTTEVKIFDINGKLVLKRKVQGSDHVSIPMMQYTDGIYIVMGKDFAEKFIKN
jgi:hypothetical protein